ncbi:MAG: efflux RND transporter periplasmic adaptor subunit, partial [Gammaproteobacteria bacterium]|nr:efflux RND transporter periplasmic adaptor subunit [Gammaproteobacteria bacterium]
MVRSGGVFLVGRWLLWVLAVVLPPTAGAATQVVPVIVVPALMMDFEDRIEALGTLRANESVALTATVTETISALHFDDGD